MIPKLKWLSSPDVDLDSFTPEEGTPWGFLLQIGLAPDDVDGADSFDVMICSPEWIGVHYGVEAVVDGRFHILMPRYSRAALNRFLMERLQESSASTWEEIVDKFGRLAEFSS